MSALYAAKTIKESFLAQTGRSYVEWRQLLLDKKPKTLDEAREFLLSEGLKPGYIDFLFWTTASHLKLTGKPSN